MAVMTAGARGSVLKPRWRSVYPGGGASRVLVRSSGCSTTDSERGTALYGSGCMFGLTRLRGAKKEWMSSSTSVLSWAEATDSRRRAMSMSPEIGGAAEICIGTRKSIEPPRPAVWRESDRARV